MPTSSTQGMLTDTLRLSLDEAQNQVNTLLLGKEQEVRLAFVALLSGGHLLLEDLPGLGKTTLAHALASSLGLTFRRVQFTSDLLPADVLGISVYNTQTQQFRIPSRSRVHPCIASRRDQPGTATHTKCTAGSNG